MKSETNENLALKFPLLIDDLTLFNSTSSYVSPYRIFFAYTKRIPNIITIDDLNIEQFKKWFEKKYQNDIVQQHYSHDFNMTKKVLENAYHNYLLQSGILVSIEYSSVYFLHNEEHLELAKELFEEAKKFMYHEQPIYLEDKELNIIYDLRQSPYSFSSAAGIFNDRLPFSRATRNGEKYLYQIFDSPTKEKSNLYFSKNGG